MTTILTDLPIILSGDYLAILEPTEAIFPNSPGRKWNLRNDRDRNELRQCHDLVIELTGDVIVDTFSRKHIWEKI